MTVVLVVIGTILLECSHSIAPVIPHQEENGNFRIG